MPKRNQKRDGPRLATDQSGAVSQIYCPECKSAMPVRKRLLLVLLDKETDSPYLSAEERGQQRRTGAKGGSSTPHA
jgi:hypothetical protein